MSVTITKRPLVPVIEITKNDASTYTFNHFTSTYDFRLRRWQCKPPFDHVGGTFKIKITSSDGSNTNMNTILSNISEGNEILIYIGKTDASKVKIFRGIIETITITEPNKNFMDVEISGPDFGSAILKNTIVNGQWNQKKSTDGVTLDATDDNVLVKQIVQDLLNKTFAYPSGPVDSITAATKGITVSAANISPPTNPRLPQFIAQYEKLDDKLTELDTITGAIHYVDPDKNFIMREPFPSTTSAPATFLLTDDYTDSVALSWDQTKLGLIAPNSTYTRTLEHHKRRIFGLGGEQLVLDTSSTTDSNQTALDATYIAQKITPKYNNIRQVAVKVSSAGTPPNDLTLELWEEVTSTPTFGTNLRTLSYPKAKISGTAGWVYFDISESVTVGNNYWIVLRKTGSTGNTFRWHHDNTDNNPSSSATSADGITWTLTSTPNRFKYTFIVDSATPLYNVVTTPSPLVGTEKHLYEDTIRNAAIKDRDVLISLLLGEASTSFKKKETLSCFVYAPDGILSTGQKIRIRKQASGYTVDSEFVIGDLEYVGDGGEDQSTGIFYYEISAARFTTYT